MGRQKKYPAEIEPERIRLGDGREFDVAALKRSVGRSRSINVSSRARSYPVYTQADRRWIAQATVEEVQIRFQLDLQQARNARFQSRRMVEAWNTLDDRSGTDPTLAR